MSSYSVENKAGNDVSAFIEFLQPVNNGAAEDETPRHQETKKDSAIYPFQQLSIERKILNFGKPFAKYIFWSFLGSILLVPFLAEVTAA